MRRDICGKTETRGVRAPRVASERSIYFRLLDDPDPDPVVACGFGLRMQSSPSGRATFWHDSLLANVQLAGPPA
jgi:hypothetical protein